MEGTRRHLEVRVGGALSRSGVFPIGVVTLDLGSIPCLYSLYQPYTEDSASLWSLRQVLHLIGSDGKLVPVGRGRATLVGSQTAPPPPLLPSLKLHNARRNQNARSRAGRGRRSGSRAGGDMSTTKDVTCRSEPSTGRKG